MADQDSEKPVPRGSSSPNSPGLSGAIRDAVAALAQSYGPKAITQRGKRIDQQAEAAQGDAPKNASLGDSLLSN